MGEIEEGKQHAAADASTPLMKFPRLSLVKRNSTRFSCGVLLLCAFGFAFTLMARSNVFANFDICRSMNDDMRFDCIPIMSATEDTDRCEKSSQIGDTCPLVVSFAPSPAVRTTLGLLANATCFARTILEATSSKSGKISVEDPMKVGAVYKCCVLPADSVQNALTDNPESAQQAAAACNSALGAAGAKAAFASLPLVSNQLNGRTLSVALAFSNDFRLLTLIAAAFPVVLCFYFLFLAQFILPGRHSPSSLKQMLFGQYGGGAEAQRPVTDISCGYVWEREERNLHGIILLFNMLFGGSMARGSPRRGLYVDPSRLFSVVLAGGVLALAYAFPIPMAIAAAPILFFHTFSAMLSSAVNQPYRVQFDAAHNTMTLWMLWGRGEQDSWLFVLPLLQHVRSLEWRESKDNKGRVTKTGSCSYYFVDGTATTFSVGDDKEAFMKMKAELERANFPADRIKITTLQPEAAAAAAAAVSDASGTQTVQVAAAGTNPTPVDGDVEAGFGANPNYGSNASAGADAPPPAYERIGSEKEKQQNGIAGSDV